MGFSMFCGERGIRTPGARKEHNGFRDRPVRPLRHLSRCKSIIFMRYLGHDDPNNLCMRLSSLIAAVMLSNLFIHSCQRSANVVEDEEEYLKSIREWQQGRLERLKSPTGWLNLAGLYWLEEGENRFGSDTANDLVFPEKAPPFCGSILVDGQRLMLQVNEGVEITHEGTPVYELELLSDRSNQRTVLRQGDLSWYIIRRGKRYGVRLRDLDHPHLRELDQIPAYPVQTDYVVEAELKPFEENRNMEVATPVERYMEEYECPGELHFRLRGENLILYPFVSGSGFFLVFADETTGLETYGGGRFLYTTPDSTGRIILDFNRAYNPPCAFSPYATCPRPPGENFLEMAVEAGEKSVHLH